MLRCRSSMLSQKLPPEDRSRHQGIYLMDLRIDACFVSVFFKTYGIWIKTKFDKFQDWYMILSECLSVQLFSINYFFYAVCQRIKPDASMIWDRSISFCLWYVIQTLIRNSSQVLVLCVWSQAIFQWIKDCGISQSYPNSIVFFWG